MRPLYFGYALTLIYSSATGCAVALLAWRRRNRPGARYLAYMSLAVAEWVFGAGIETIAVGQDTKIFWSQLLYIGFVFSTPFLLRFALEYCGVERGFWFRVSRWLWIPSLVALALTWTNRWHGLVWTSFSPGPVGTNVLIYHHGVAHTAIAAYLCTLLAVSFVLLTKQAARTGGLFRRQAVAVVLAMLVAVPGGAVYMFWPQLVGGLDTTPFGFWLTDILLAIAILRNRLLDLVPVAYQVVFERIGEGIAVFDDQFRLLDMNPAAEILLGQRRDATGRSAEAVLPARLAAVLRHGASSVELALDGTPPAFVESRVYPIVHSRRQTVGWLVVLIDVTARMQAQAALEKLNAVLEDQVTERTAELTAANASLQAASASLKEMDALKSRFVASISHELRTPLANIKLYLSLLTAGKAEKRDHYLATLNQQSDLLRSLVEQMLTVSQLEASGNALRRVPVDVNAVMEVIAADNAERAGHRMVDLVLALAPDLPPFQADLRVLRPAIDSLIVNALSYTPQGGCVRVATALVQQAGEPWLAISVVDNGAGIAPEELPHIFERFYRGRAALEFGVPGVGLGLSTCRDAVERHGGRVSVAEQVERGSKFTIWLPITN